jgi:hypothetical protein
LEQQLYPFKLGYNLENFKRMEMRLRNWNDDVEDSDKLS